MPGLVSTRRRVLVAAALGAIVAVAVVVRVWKLRWGLRSGMAFTDELQLWTSYLTAFVPLRPQSFLREDSPAALLYPAFYGILSGLATAGAHAIGLIPAPRTDILSAIYVARLVSATASLLNVLLIGLLGWRIGSARTGLFAAALAAVVPVEAMQVHYASVDPLLGACVTLTLLLACELVLRASSWTALAAGGAAGLAFGAKYTGLIVFGSCGWALLEVCLRERSLRPLVRMLPVAVVGFVAMLLVACPPCVLQSSFMFRAISGLSSISSTAYLRFWDVQLLPTLGWYGKPYLYQLFAGLPFGLGWPLYFAAIAGVVSLARHARAVDRVLLVTLGVYFVSVGMTFVVEATRYYIPMVPILMVATARMLDGLSSSRLRAALFAGIWIYTAAFTLSQVERYSFNQQMEVANFVRRTVPAPAAGRIRVAYPQGLDAYYGLRQPIIWAGLTPVAAPSGRWLEERPEAFVIPELTAVRLKRDAPDGVDAQALARIERGETEYRPVRSWRSHYLQSDLYTTLDPVFVGDYAQGEIGFTVYLRGDLAAGREARP